MNMITLNNSVCLVHAVCFLLLDDVREQIFKFCTGVVYSLHPNVICPIMCSALSSSMMSSKSDTLSSASVDGGRSTKVWHAWLQRGYQRLPLPKHVSTIWFNFEFHHYPFLPPRLLHVAYDYEICRAIGRRLHWAMHNMTVQCILHVLCSIILNGLEWGVNRPEVFFTNGTIVFRGTFYIWKFSFIHFFWPNRPLGRYGLWYLGH